MKQLFLILLSIFCCISCDQKSKSTQAPATGNYRNNLIQKESDYAEKQSYNGDLLNTISFNVKADTQYFDDGIQPWINIEKPEADLSNLIDKNEVVISDKTISVIIDYPLTVKHKFELKSSAGYTRQNLIRAISKEYHKIYEEEEKSATVKTLPMEKRKIYNRNETNGKYGIWGHDLADLVLADIFVYKITDGQIVLILNMES